MTPITHAISLARKGASMSHAERGELASLLARTSKSHSPEVKALLKRLTVNIGSTGESGQLTAFLYRPAPEGLGLPPIYIKEHGRNTDRLACDTNALLHHWRSTKNPCLKLCLDITNRATQLETLAAKLDADGRLRWSVTIDGTETGRQTTRKSPTGSGYNLHATAETHKHLIRADAGNLLGWVDLNGADGWTIAAECAQLGDQTMLEDLRYGVKPAEAVGLLYNHGAQVNQWARSAMKVAIPSMKAATKWLYPACKKVIWGTCYDMRERRLSEQILEESYKEDGEPLYVEPRVCKQLQALVHQRYKGIDRRKGRIRMQLARDGFLRRANGSRRDFFGRKDDDAVLREAYADHPQVVTTWVTELAWERMWYDPENVVAGARVCSPRLLVHDSIVFEFPADRVEWVRASLRRWFENPVTIAGVTLVVPYSGNYGPSWAKVEATGAW